MSASDPDAAGRAARRRPTAGRLLWALEPAAGAIACAIAAAVISARLLRADVLSADALVHQYWMAGFHDPALFTDPLTSLLRESERYPQAYEALFRLATTVANPIVFGEWLGVGLMALSGWLVFCVVREITPWRPGAWIAAALFLLLIEIHRFHGGFPRAFVHPVVLTTVLLSIRGHLIPAGLVAGLSALVYPPAALLAGGVLCVSALGWAGRRPRIEPRRAVAAGLAVAITAVAVLGPRLLGGDAQHVFTAAEARVFPEFGPQGVLKFFADSTLDFLRQNRSGFDLRTSGSILAVAGLALVVLRPANLRSLRREIVAMPVVALAAFALAHAVLFQLYLPHRYTYPLVAFFAIVVGVTLRPTWEALGPGTARAALLLVAPVLVAAVAVFAFPLGPLRPLERVTEDGWLWALAGGAAIAAVVATALRRVAPPGRAAVGAALTGIVLVGAMLVVPQYGPRGTVCATTPVTRHLAGLPKDAIIAGDPSDLKCLPGTARRAVVISTQLSPSYEAEYFFEGRARMFAALRAQYGPSRRAIAALGTRYGATHLWVRPLAIRRELTVSGRRWKARELPYGRFVRGLVAAGAPASLRLPRACLTWARPRNEVYDLGCVARRAP